MTNSDTARNYRLFGSILRRDASRSAKNREADDITRMSDAELLDLCCSIYQDRKYADRIRKLLSSHELNRLRKSLEMIPRARNGSGRLVDIGAATYWIPAYQRLGYTEITALTKLQDDPNFSAGDIGNSGEDVSITHQHADAETDRYAIESDSIDVVCCFEVLEHLLVDPMGMMAEINRILKPGGLCALTTPNIAGWRSVVAALRGRNPNNWSPYAPDPELSIFRHHREYTFAEVGRLAEASGLSVEKLYTPALDKTGGVKESITRLTAHALIFLATGRVANREPHVFLLGRKTQGVKDRYPDWLYMDFGSHG